MILEESARQIEARIRGAQHSKRQGRTRCVCVSNALVTWRWYLTARTKSAAKTYFDTVLEN